MNMNKKIVLAVLALVVVLGGIYLATRSSQNDKKMQKDETIINGEEMEHKMKQDAATAKPEDGAMMNEDGSMMNK